ncbi:MAG: hypothetical protein U9Q40_04890 [Campylobacterota bacterium]|nr:hypothetical protein [Campylobacterota bacterium]
MIKKLFDLKKIAHELYVRYSAGLLSLDEYQELLRPIDRAIDALEMDIFTCVSPCKQLTQEEIIYN